VAKWQWWKNGEYEDEIGDTQAGPDFNVGPADVGNTEQQLAALARAPLGEPPVGFDVRCTFDSRIVNSYDFLLSATLMDGLNSGAPWIVTFQVPNGYRMIPREWEVYFDNPPSGLASNSTVTLQQQGAAIPNNGPIAIGSGTSDPIKTFFLCEENTNFGMTGHNSNLTSGIITGYVRVYGNLIAVSDVALPFAAANKNSLLRGSG